MWKGAPPSMKCAVKSATHKQKYHLDMLADTGGEQKRMTMITGRALTDAINEDNKRGEGDLSGRYSDIPGKTGWLVGNKKGGKLQESVRRHSNAEQVQTTCKIWIMGKLSIILDSQIH